MYILQGILGIFALLLAGYALSANRKGIQVYTVVAAFSLQVLIGALALRIPFGTSALNALATGVNHVIEKGNAGVDFMFGGLVSSKMFDIFGGLGFVFAFKVLPMIIFMTALIAVLYHCGVMKWFVIIVGGIFKRLLRVSEVEALAAVSTIFLGMSEIPAVIRPFLKDVSRSELFAAMSSGMASVSGAVLAGYAGLGINMTYLLAASFMAIPGGLLFGKLIQPGVPTSAKGGKDVNEIAKQKAGSFIEAAGNGATLGLRIAVLVGATLIAFIGLIALADFIIGGIGSWIGYPNISMEFIFGHVFAPLAWLIGVPWRVAGIGGDLLGTKLVLNEFIAFVDLARDIHSANPMTTSGLSALDHRSVAILSISLCGFANFSSIAIVTGCFSAVIPERKTEIAALGWRVLAAGSLSNLMSATIAGIMLAWT